MSNQRRRPLKVGLGLFPMEGLMDGRTARWTDIVAMAHQTEEVGFDSIWVNDHFLLRLDAWPPAQSPVNPAEETTQVGMWECLSVLRPGSNHLPR